MDVGNVAAVRLTMQQALQQQRLGIQAIKLAHQAQEGVVSLLNSAVQQGSPAQTRPAGGLDIRV